MKATVELSGMEFHAFHGCLEKERREGALFTVDFSCITDISRAAASDCLEDTVDYSEIYDIVASQMVQPSNLLENVASRIVSAIASAHPELEEFKIKVVKHNPPVAGPAAESSVTIIHKK